MTRNLHGNIAKLYVFSLLQMTLFPMAIVTLFWKDQIGLTLTQILVVQSLFSIATILLDYPAGYVSDRLGYRLSLSIASIFGMAGWGFYTVARSFSGVLLAEILLGISLSFISGSDSALLYETLRAEGKQGLYARFQGRMTGFSQGGEALGAICAGVMYARWPLLPFFLQVLVFLCALLVTRTMVESPRESGHKVRSHLAEALATARYALVDNKVLRYNILLNTLLGLASFFPVWLIQPYMRSAGVPLPWFGPVWAGANLIVALSALASHRVHERLGDRLMVVLFFLLVSVGYFGLGVAGGVWGFLFYYLLTCMRGLRGPMMLAHTQSESPSERRASVLSLQSVSFRISFACVAPLIGRLADAVGPREAFAMLLYLFLAGLPPLSILWLRRLRQGHRL